MMWLLNNWRIIFCSVLLFICAAMIKTAFYYNGKYNVVQKEASERQRIIDDMQQRQKLVSVLDAKYTQELADAKSQNDRLRNKLAAGGRVRVTGECKLQAARARSMGHDSAIELSTVAGSNVLNIRAGIISDQRKIKYLQDYIRQQCQ